MSGESQRQTRTTSISTAISDYVMYIIVVNSERAEELVDTEQPHRMIQAAREVFGELYEEADSEYAANRLSSILKSLDTLEDRVEEIEKDALVTGLYETNMERLDLNTTDPGRS